MLKIVTAILFYFLVSTAYAQLDKDYLRIRDGAEVCLQISDYTCARTKFNLALKIKKDDAYCKQRLVEIDQRELQSKRNKEERLRLERSREAEGTGGSAKPYFGVLRGLIDYKNEKFNYKGYILNKKPHGKGKADYNAYTKSSGWEDATWVKGKRNGPCRATYPDGSRYEGNYKNDMLNGPFISHVKDGSKYELFYKDNKMVGIQKIYPPDKSRVEIKSENGELSGCATWFMQDGDRLEGYLKNEIFVGEVTIHSKNGQRIVGTLTNEEANGPVKIYTEDGDRIEVDFKNNVPIGRAITHFPDSSNMEMIFENGELKEGVVWSFANGEKYVGPLKEGEKSGYGKYNYANGDFYEGQWLDDKYNGLGRFTAAPNLFITNCPKCVVYEGEWKNGVKDGYGKCYDIKRKLLYSGKFKNDKPVEKYPGKR
ncbi:MORN repeat-containing protein [Dyadobacter psychrotolerans]|uniref:MORN repeat protein n=1 Tax=Dyadobacter psychrotolerans TaxID=2541721 RepID=A0A4R5D6R8_9BACT|nr:hypothetical protein [Dyadobacter psychrotolerans]TDE08297.1 hypothetical protein E0F88_32880 [Dyadobacter psychrotolerans]